MRQEAFRAHLASLPRFQRLVHQITCAEKDRIRGHLAALHLRGRGLEIGAQDNPTRVQKGVRVAYVDRLTRAETARKSGLDPKTLVEPTHLLDAESLAGIADQSQDFLIALHVLEHADEPLAVLREWLRVLRPGGALLLGLPNATANEYDFMRRPLPLAHFVAEGRASDPAARREHKLAHWREFIELVDEVAPESSDFAPLLRRYIEEDDRIHFHVYDRALALALAAHLAESSPLAISDAFSLPGCFEIFAGAQEGARHQAHRRARGALRAPQPRLAALGRPRPARRPPPAQAWPGKLTRSARADRQHLLQIGLAFDRLDQTVLQEGRHAARDGEVPDLLDAALLDDGALDLVVVDEQLVDADAPLVAGVAARAAARALPELELAVLPAAPV